MNNCEVMESNVESIARMPVPTVNGSTPASKIASIMVKNNIGAVIVVKMGEPVGIVTEKDIINRIIESKKDADDIIAEQVMTSPLITISYDRTVKEAFEIMRSNNVRRLVVLKGKKIVGLLTERRLLLVCFPEHKNELLQKSEKEI
ncbi:MAG: CBS domain-containing protein [Thermoproteota archaeon]|nr:CBS domain-containing protein [Thermoproteota archaeon]NLD65615.1 CBS domain-containing protein [Thermoproteota archaeon]